MQIFDTFIFVMIILNKCSCVINNCLPLQGNRNSQNETIYTEKQVEFRT